MPGHKLWNKDQIIKELWGVIRDVEENGESMVETCGKVGMIGGGNERDCERFRRILERKSCVWYEKVKQAVELVSMDYGKSDDIEPFVSENLPVTQKILMHLTTAPVSEGEPQTLVYITRGSCDVFIYNFLKQSFTNLKSSQKIIKWSGITQYSPTEVLITGGKLNKNNGSVSTCFSLNINTGQVEPFPDMLSCHSSHISLLHHHTIYIISGKNSNNGISNSCEKLDLSTKTWTSLCNIIIGRTCAAGVVHKENIFIIGGCKNNTVEKYTISEDQWVLLEFKLFEVVWQHLAVDLSEQVLIFGGDSINDAPTRYSYLLDMETGEVSQLDVLPVGQSWLCGWYPCTTRGNRIWVMNKELKFLTYNLSTNQWSSYKNKLRKTK